MGRTRTMCGITHGLAPYSKSILVDAIGRSDVCKCSFDESLNKVTQSSEMDLYVRFWNADSNQVQSRYFGSSFLGHTTHLDLLTHFRDLAKDLNPSKLYQISMDGPNTNLKFFNEYSNKLAETTFHFLFKIGTCNLILFMGASKLVKLHLDGVWKILWRVLIEFYITVMQEGKIMLVWLGQ